MYAGKSLSVLVLLMANQPFDGIWNHHGDKALDLPVRKFLHWVN